MADSSYLIRVVEPFVVNWVSKKIGIPLRPRKIPVGKKMDGANAHFAFDGVSDDGKVGLLVSTSHTLKPGGTRKLHVDASVILQAPFKRRIMAFINSDAMKNFVNKCDGLLPLAGIEMVVCSPLPPEMMREIERFQAISKKEVGDKGKQWKVGGQRR
ncbi:MAG: hypothetical protein A2270_08100 [Elusimicrobia bacterium RIFOXYA12_FULL_51_18]|nr:MAG: hypothetical protein A2270_08100 [Elusimicrobia bacterium RIFOXYA12_FULL_51_18]OGS28551.1 MAG: hypothetical protein A2218_04890 [Elusimicrobia bacterium RIFOXYA2_FULL_53_38]